MVKSQNQNLRAAFGIIFMLAASPLVVTSVDDLSENINKQSEDTMTFAIAFLPGGIENLVLVKSFELFQMDPVTVELLEVSRSNVGSFKTSVLVV